MLHGKKLKGVVYKSYVWPAILYGSDSWCLKKRDRNVTKDRKTHGEGNVWSTAQRQKKIYRFDVYDGAINSSDTSEGQLAMETVFVGMFRRNDGHVLRTLDPQVEGQREAKEDMEKAG